MPAQPTVVVVHAHPDDEAIFTAATMVRMSRRGWRVVLVTATGGERGHCLFPLPRGETLQRRRRAELERSCDLLGVQRLVMLGYADSGATLGSHPRGSLGDATRAQVSRRLAAVAVEEGADALIHYDCGGIYGHVDHVRVHQAGAMVSQRLGIPSYQATVDPLLLRRRRRHVLHAAAFAGIPLGVHPEAISITVHADRAELAAKHAAMAAHASQIELDGMDASAFACTYDREWFLRTGPAGPLESWDRELAATG
jgi:LmbE family N-acetylglucosaminyl deacetylase